MEAIILGDLKLPFSHAVRVGEMVFVSGQASVDLDTGNIVGGTLAEEIERSMKNLRTVVEKAGARWENIVKVGCFVRRDEDLPEFNRLYREYFSEPFPARTTVTNCLPPSLLFEIDCVALID
ncbi:MAG TPA: RidA family protein [Pyrinomonadaceae bacterium]|nr:RidA family protein [Pyrinomonadaceae bacterium]